MADILNPAVGDMTLSDLRRLIITEVRRQTPAIPAGVSALGDKDLPLTSPDPQTVGDHDALVFNPLTGQWGAGTPANATTAVYSDGGADGYAPGSSPQPTLVGGTNFMAVTWDAVTLNAHGDAQRSPVTYEVHISSVDGFTPSGSTLYGEIVGTGMFIKHLPDGSPLNFLTPYYVRLIAKDVDGSAAAGTQSTSADMVQINGRADIQTGSIKATLLESQLVLSTTILAGTPGGARIEMSPAGIIIYDGSGNPQTTLPADGSTSKFAGDVETNSLQVDGNMTVSGTTNVMDKGSQLTLLDRVADPSGAPTINWNIQKLAVTGDPASNSSAGAAFEINSTNGYWSVLTDGTNNKSYLSKYDATGAYQARLLLGGPWNQVYDITLLGGVLYVLYQDGSGNFHLGKVTNPTNTGTWAFTTIAAITSGITTSTGMALTNDGTNLVIISYHGLSTSAVLRAATYSTSGVFGATTDLVSGGVLQIASGLRFLAGATYDGTNWWVGITDLSAKVNHVEKYVASTHTLVADANASWALEGTWYLGMAWNSTTSRFEMLGNHGDGVTGYIYKPTDWTWAHASGDKFFVQYSWYDGSHESLSSAAQTANLATPTGGVYPQQYGRINVTVPTFPSSVTNVRTFMLQGSGSAPAAGATTGWLQTVSTYADSNSTTSYHILKYLGSGTHPITPSTFTGATSTLVATASGIAAPWKLGGDGEMRMPNQTTAARYASPNSGDAAYNTTTKFPEFYDGSNWVIEGEREEMEIAKALVDLGSSDTYPITSPYDPVNATALSGGAFATGNIYGVAQMTRQTKTATGIMVFNGAAGTAGTFNGAALYHLNAAGDWVFDIDSGSTTQGSVITGTGAIKIPFTATYTIIPGRVYIAAVIRAFTGSPTFAGVGALAANIGGTTGPVRCASAAKTGRQNATIAVAGLTVRTILPYQCIY